MSKLTYIWGAGASAGTFNDQRERLTGVPVVSHLKEALDVEIAKLNEFISNPFEDFNPGEWKLTKEQCDELLAALKRLREMMDKSDTIDHYAKQLLMENRVDVTCGVDYNQPYKYCKRLLAIFLLLIQDRDRYDLRYDTFITEVFNEKHEQPKLTILSWNYDAQFEFAWAKYARSRYILDIWDEINVYNKTCGTNYDGSKPFALVKLNGTAFFRDHMRETSEYKARYTVPDFFYGGYDKKEKYEFLHKLLTAFYEESTLSYAWDNMGNDLIEAVKERVKDTEELIVVGYSYPKFNKDIDKQILEAMPHLKHVVIQDRTEKACQEIEKHIRTLIDSKNISYEYDTNVSRFHVPYGYDGYAKEELVMPKYR